MNLPSPRHWGTVAEAAAALAAAALATRLLSFDRTIRIGARSLSTPREGDGKIESRIVDALANRAPFRAVCLQRGLALQWLLRRRGVDAVLHYGIRLDPGDGPQAHVWVSVGDEVVNGAPQHLHYTQVARYPAA